MCAGTEAAGGHSGMGVCWIVRFIVTPLSQYTNLTNNKDSIFQGFSHNGILWECYSNLQLGGSTGMRRREGPGGCPEGSRVLVCLAAECWVSGGGVCKWWCCFVSAACCSPLSLWFCG